MRHVRMRALGLAFAGMLVIAAWTAGNASALPEFGQCHESPTHEGKYTDANCLTKAKKVSEKFTGAFEWNNSTTFAGRGVATEVVGCQASEEPGGSLECATTLAATFVKCVPNEEKLAKCREGESEERIPVTVTCPGGLSRGHLSTKSDKEINDYTTRLFNCEAAGVTCGNGSTVGEIEGSNPPTPELVNNPLKGVLGYVKKEGKEVGIDWKPEVGHEFAKFTCGGAMDVILGGAVEKEGPAHPPKGGGGATIAAVSPVDEMQKKVRQTLALNNETDENVPSSFEGRPLQALEGWFYNPEALGKASKWSPAGESQSIRLEICDAEEVPNCTFGISKETDMEIRA